MLGSGRVSRGWVLVGFYHYLDFLLFPGFLLLFSFLFFSFFLDVSGLVGTVYYLLLGVPLL